MGSNIFRTVSAFLFLLLVTEVELSAQVSAGFTVNTPTYNCNPAVYTFTNISSGVAPLTYAWNFGVFQGVNSVFQNPATTYLGCGTFNVKLVVTDGLGQQDSTSQAVTINCSPTATFTTPDSAGCIPFSTAFTSTSVPGSGAITSYLWDFGDGYTGTGSDPAHTYTEAGCKNITLIVTNSFGCTNHGTVDNALCTFAQPEANFADSGSSTCATPATVNYQNETDSGGLAPYSYQWIFQGGTPGTSAAMNPSVTYNSAGSYTTTLITNDANGCADTVMKTGFVNIPINTANFTLSTLQGCTNSLVTANGISSASPVLWKWTVSPAATIGNDTAQNTTLTFADSGTYNICLTITYAAGCTAQKCSTVVIYPGPTADYSIAGNLNSCSKPDVITFTSSSTGSELTYTWSFPGGAPNGSAISSPPSISYDVCGTYSASLTVTDQNGCKANYSTPDFLTISCPAASFTAAPSTGCAPLTTVFNSTTTAGNPVSWSWNFGDPASGAANTSTLQNPSHTYNNPGCYTIILAAVTSDGCTIVDTLNSGVCTGNKPHANFSANPPFNCADKPVFFTDSSTNTYQYTTYFWDFNGGPPYTNESNLQNPSFIYGDTGYMNVSLLISNYGCADTITKDNYVYLFGPISIVQPHTDCSNESQVLLDGTASIDAQQYSWAIPGGSPSSAVTSTVSVTYPGPGIYPVTLLTTNDSTGCQYIQTVDVKVNDLQAQFTGSPLTGCSPIRSCMSSTSVGVYSYNWAVTDTAGNLVGYGNEASPCFGLTNPGFYNVQMIVIDSIGCSDTLTRLNYIDVTKPMVDFNGVPVNGCAPLTVNFMDLSSSTAGTIIRQEWNFGDNTAGANDSSASPNPIHIYNNVGSYTVSLIVTDNIGCTGNLSKLEYVQTHHLDANFTSVITNNCQGTQGCFSIDSQGVGLSYQWNFGDGDTSNLVGPCHNYTNGGTYTIKLLLSDTTGCVDSSSIINTVNVSRPHAVFVADTTSSSCPPLQVIFSNLSTAVNAQTTYLWMFGDGQVSTAQNPVHIYSVAGQFGVTLIVTNQNGCQDTLSFTNYVDIGGPSAYISTHPTSGCTPHYTCFQAVSTSTINYTWNFGDGTVEVSSDSVCYTYTRPGTFFPELILNDGAGCVYSLPIGQVNIGGAVAYYKLDDSSLCNNGTVNFTDSSYGTSLVKQWQWNFDDPSSGNQNTSSLQDPSHYFAGVGTYNVVMTITTNDGCANTYSRTVTVTPPPNISFGISGASVCTGGTIYFTDQTSSSSPVASRLWDFGDPSSGAANTSQIPDPSHIYQHVGSFKVTLSEVANNSCSSIDSSVIMVNQSPVASFAVTNTCLNQQPILFSNNSQFGTFYEWFFGDGNSSAQFAPSNMYADSGVYNIQLTVFNDFCSDTFISQVKIFPLPVAAFSVSPPGFCGPPFTLNITNTSTGAIDYLWNFGNNETSTVTDPTQLYASLGQDTITLIARNLYLCADTSVLPITIHQRVVAAFSAYDTCLNSQPIVFQNNSQFASSYFWNFGDGTNSSQIDPPHTYSDSGTYQVQLIVSDIFCRDTAYLPVQVYPVPNAAFTVSTPSFCGPPVTVQTQNATTGAVNYFWNFGNNTTSALTNPVVSYGAVGQDTITLVAQNVYSCTDTAALPVVIHQQVLAAFTANDTCLNTQPLLFQNNSQFASVYAWNFGDGSIISQPSPSHSYSDSGLYLVQLIVSDDFCSDTATSPVQIYPVPVAVFTVSSPSFCGPPVVFKSQNNSLGASTYQWDFGNNVTSTLINPVISYNSVGQYVISLTVRNAYFCISTATDTINVYQKVVDAFTAFDTCLNAQPIYFQNNSQFANKYFWNFGDDGVSQATDPSHTYSDSGIYVVQLSASNDFCRDTFSALVSIYPLPTASFSLPSGYQCGNLTPLNIQNTSTGATSYLWNLGNNTESTAIDPYVTYSSPGQYIISLVAQNSYSCQDTASAPYIIYPNPVIQSINISPAQGCQPLRIVVSASATNGQSYTWNFGDNSAPVTTDTQVINYTYTDTGTFTISLQVLSFKDCGDTAILTDTIKVHVVPIADFQDSINTAVDPINGIVVFTNTSRNADNYVWNFGDGSGSTDVNPTHLYQDVDSFSVILVAETRYGCLDSISKVIYVLKKTLYVPNAFAPEFVEGNALVRVWKPAGTGLSTYHAQIFDKWGELLWESTALTENNEPAEGWDGTYQGKLCQQDVYVWKIDAVFVDGSRWDGTSYKGAPKKTIGSVTLVR